MREPSSTRIESRMAQSRQVQSARALRAPRPSATAQARSTAFHRGRAYRRLPEAAAPLPWPSDYILYDPFSTTINQNGDSRPTPISNNDLRPAGPGRTRALPAVPAPERVLEPLESAGLSNYAASVARVPISYRLDTRIDYRLTDNDTLYVHRLQVLW
jgi:hypothetical protein